MDTTVSLVIELGRIPMTLQQVGEIAKGQVLQLAQTSNDPVNLVMGDKTIGQGELVEVDGKIGVKITSMSSK